MTKHPLFLLDFDGVLFDSAVEAYLVCQKMAELGLVSRKDVCKTEFMRFRKSVKDAWHYGYLYNKPHNPLPSEPDDEDEIFASNFFKTRKNLAKDDAWYTGIPAYHFFKNIKQHMLDHPSNFKIISTRNEESICRILKANGIHKIEVLGQSSVKEAGGKVQAATQAGLLKTGRFTVYIDDMLEYTNQFSSHVDLALHASWGYGYCVETSLSEKRASTLFACLFAGIKDEV